MIMITFHVIHSEKKIMIPFQKYLNKSINKEGKRS